MEVIGTLKKKMDTKQVSDKFKSREFVLTTEAGGKYPQQVIFQLSQDKCDAIDRFNVGDEIKLQFNLRGREWTNPQGEVKYFNSLEAWRLEKVGDVSSNSTPAEKTAKTNVSESNVQTFTASNDSDDDLPF